MVLPKGHAQRDAAQIFRQGRAPVRAWHAHRVLSCGVSRSQGRLDHGISMRPRASQPLKDCAQPAQRAGARN